MIQIYIFPFLSENLRSESLKKFLSSGRSKSIKKAIVTYLASYPKKSYTAAELTAILKISYRSSVCKPLKDLVDAKMVQVIGSKYDRETGREVGSYQLSKEPIS